MLEKFGVLFLTQHFWSSKVGKPGSLDKSELKHYSFLRLSSKRVKVLKKYDNKLIKLYVFGKK